jgi:hypothetical protein
VTTPLAGLLTGIIIILPGPPGDPGQPATPEFGPPVVAAAAPEGSRVVVLPGVGPTLTAQPLPSAGRQAGVTLGGARTDLSRWKLTLPTGSQGKPREIARPNAAASPDRNWFSASPDDGIVFRAPVNGVTTKGSKNPRSELREMTGDGSTPASWSSTSGTHAMRVVEAFTHLPTGKPALVGAQIHDAADDITVFRLEGSNLYVTDGNNPHYKLVTSSYQLGTPFEATYVVSGGQVRAYVNGQLVATLAKNFTGAYFKAGAYTQANCSNSSPCSPANYGETVIYDLQVTHTR